MVVQEIKLSTECFDYLHPSFGGKKIEPIKKAILPTRKQDQRYICYIIALP
jgi:hypothetical protein